MQLNLEVNIPFRVEVFKKELHRKSKQEAESVLYTPKY